MEESDKKLQKIKDRILSKNENILYQFSLGKTFIIFNFITFIILGCVVIPIFIYILFKELLISIIVSLIFIPLALFFRFYQNESNKYFFTDKRIIVMTGLLDVKTISVDYEKITDIKIYGPFLEKIFYKTGDIIVNTAGSSKDEIYLKRIEKPYEIKKIIEEIKDGDYNK